MVRSEICSPQLTYRAEYECARRAGQRPVEYLFANLERDMPAIATRETVKLFVNGRLAESKSARSGPVFNPSIGEQIAEVPFCSAEETARVIQAAHEAFPKWRDTPVVERARVMFRLVALLEKNAEDLARTVSLEHGKTHAEAVGSVRR